MTRMKCAHLLVLIGILTCFGASPASSQTGFIAPFSDPGGSSCAFVDAAPGIVLVYVFQTHTVGSRGARFRLNVDGLNWTHLGDVSEFAITSGVSIDGIIVCYDDCLEDSFLLLTANFFGSGLAPVCSQISVDPYPGAGVEALDCDWNVVNPTTGVGIVNPNAGCYCHACGTATGPACTTKLGPAGTNATNFCAALPVKQSTWGMIKALYD